MERLGKIKADFKEHVIWAKVKGEKVEIRGDHTLSHTVASLKAIMKEIDKGVEAYYVDLGTMDVNVVEIKGDMKGLKGILKGYA